VSLTGPTFVYNLNLSGQLQVQSDGRAPNSRPILSAAWREAQKTESNLAKMKHEKILSSKLQVYSF
jgi:hypothetical protein